jgi:hypothetical protein
MIVAGVVAIFAAVISGAAVTMYVIGLSLGIIGNVMYWLGKPKPGLDYTDTEETPPDGPK